MNTGGGCSDVRIASTSRIGQMEGSVDPLLKWVGSKRWHVQQVARYHDREVRTVELFCGGCAMTLGLTPRRALLNDANPHLINFYQQAQTGLDFEGFDLTGSEGLYYDYRAWFNRLVREGRSRTPDAAQLFYYLMHHGYNGLCRFNQKGEFNVPHRPGRTAPVRDWAAVREQLKSYVFTNDDFGDVMLEEDDFVYADPPYDGTFNDYTENGWSCADMEMLALMLRHHPGRVIIMNSATPWVLSLFKDLGYVTTLVESKQSMHRSQGRSDVVPEVMATNFSVDLGDNITPGDSHT